MPSRGGGGGWTPNGKYHLKIPFWLLAHLPKNIICITLPLLPCFIYSECFSHLTKYIFYIFWRCIFLYTWRHKNIVCNTTLAMFHIFRMLLAPDQVHFLPGPEFQVRHNYITFNVWLCFRFQKFEQKKRRDRRGRWGKVLQFLPNIWRTGATEERRHKGRER